MRVFLLGFLLIFAGMVVLILNALINGLPDGVGLIIFIGPIPFIISAGEYALLAVALAVILTILGIILFAVTRAKRST